MRSSMSCLRSCRREVVKTGNACKHTRSRARFVDRRSLARIQGPQLLARNVVDGFINGLHRAPFFGASVDFAEHRGYSCRR